MKPLVRIALATTLVVAGGMTPALASTPTLVPDPFYGNACPVPDGWTRTVADMGADHGVRYSNPAHDVVVTCYRQFALDGTAAEVDRTRTYLVDQGWTITFENRDATSLTLSGTKNGSIVYGMVHITPGTGYGRAWSATWTYPADQQDQYGPLVEHAEDLVAGAFASKQGATVSPSASPTDEAAADSGTTTTSAKPRGVPAKTGVE